MRSLAAAMVLLAPLVLGSGCVTLASQWALGNVGCHPPPPVVVPADHAWVVEGTDGPDRLIVEHRDEDGGEARRVVSYDLDRFEKDGSIEAATDFEVEGAYVPPAGARSLRISDGALPAGQGPAGDAVGVWGDVQIGAARYRVVPVQRPEPLRASRVLAVAIAPITVALDIGLLPVYATVAIGAGAGYGVYRGGQAIGDALD